VHKHLLAASLILSPVVNAGPPEGMVKQMIPFPAQWAGWSSKGQGLPLLVR
jgi:hypothetical protein